MRDTTRDRTIATRAALAAALLGGTWLLTIALSGGGARALAGGSGLATLIHTAGHTSVSEAPVGAMVHPWTQVFGSPVPTGTLTYSRHTTADCSGASTAQSAPLPLSGGIVDGTAFAFTSATAGTVRIRGQYSGDASTASLTFCQSITFTKINPTIRLRVHDDFHTEVTTVGPASLVHGYVTLAGSLGTPTGSVVIATWPTPDCSGTAASQTSTVVNGVVEPTIRYQLNSGTRTFKATYGGNLTYNNVTSPCVSVAVAKVAPTLGIAVHDMASLVPDNWPVGMDLFLAATVSGPNGTPTGNVSIRRHRGVSCGELGLVTSQASLNGSGQASHGPWRNLDPGAYSIQVRYNGDTTYAAKVTCRAYSMQKATLSVPLNVHNAGHQVVPSVKAGAPFHMTTSLASPAGTPTNNVTFARWTNPDCTGALIVTYTVALNASGSAESPAVTLNTPGTWGLRVAYNGDTRYNSSASACQPFTVAQANASASLALHNSGHQVISQPILGQSVHAQVDFTGPAGLPAGTATWQIWPTADCSGTAGHTASGAISATGSYHVSTSFFPAAAGAHSQRVSYSGSSVYVPFVGPCLPVTVARATPTVTAALHNAAHQAVTSVPINIPIHVYTQVGGTVGTPTGSVTFRLYSGSGCQSAPYQVVTALVGVEAHQVEALPPAGAGPRSYKAIYSGDAKYAPRESACVNYTATKGDPGLSMVLHNPAHAPVTTVTVGTVVHPRVSVTGLAAIPATGTVTAKFYAQSDCTGLPFTFPTGTLAGGVADLSGGAATAFATTVAFRFTYSGDANWLPDTGPCVPLIVTKATPTLGTVVHTVTHSNTSTVQVGTQVHAKGTLAGVSNVVITGTLTFRWHANGSCTSLISTEVVSVSPQAAGAESGPFTSMVGGTRWVQVQYSGSNGYFGVIGQCMPVTFTKIGATMTLDVHSTGHLVVTSVPIGSNVHPAVSLSGYLGVPTGSIEFRWFTNGTCSGDGVPATLSLNGGTLDAFSLIATLDSPGTGSFRATWGGDATHNPATSPCAPVIFNEKLEVEVELAVHDAAHGAVTNVPEGTSIHPRAAVTGSGPTPTGSVRFRWYDDIGCGRISTATSPPIALVGGVADGTAFTQTPPTEGTVAFVVEYSGDGQYNGGVSACAFVTVTFSGPAVVSFKPDVTPTGATTLTWSLVFDEPITGLAPADITPGGTSTGWSVTNVAGSGTDWTITTKAANPTHGPLVLTLGADGVANGEDRSGPNEPFVSEAAIILPFSDITGSTFQADIVWLSELGITTGCGFRIYCPDAPVTRAQMASFLARALELPATPIDFFDDDDGTTHETNINRLAAAGITLGCGPSIYCPNANVTRAEMASFLVRALGLTAGGDIDAFTDDDDSTHEININRLKFAGLTTGCSTTTFCPAANVTRGQMAAFLHRALMDQARKSVSS